MGMSVGMSVYTMSVSLAWTTVGANPRVRDDEMFRLFI
jgi:hypothetical protein